MSRRLQIVLPDPVATQLEELAAAAAEPLATVARQIVRDGVALAAKSGKVKARRPAPTVVSEASGRPRWLEPYGGDPAWRQQMWGAIVALHGRYPRQLQDVKTGWWTDDSQAETLCALAVWRAEIDNAGQNPREELAFQHQLDHYSRALRHQGGSIAKAWQPGAPPEEWTKPGPPSPVADLPHDARSQLVPFPPAQTTMAAYGLGTHRDSRGTPGAGEAGDARRRP